MKKFIIYILLAASPLLADKLKPSEQEELIIALSGLRGQASQVCRSVFTTFDQRARCAPCWRFVVDSVIDMVESNDDIRFREFMIHSYNIYSSSRGFDADYPFGIIDGILVHAYICTESYSA